MDRRAFLTSAVVLGASATMASARAQSASNADAIKGAWVLQQTPAKTSLEATPLGKALGEPNIVGFSQRVNWAAIDGDLTLLESGYDLASSHGLLYTPRFMAGRWTAQSVFAAGSPHYTLATGEKVPTPFFPDGSPNTIFETHWNKLAVNLAKWCRARGIRILHLPWYGQMWAEIDNGNEVRTQPGYTYAAWLKAHERLIDLAIAQSGPDLAVEFPLTGHGPIASNGSYPVVRDLSDYIVAKNGPCRPNFFVQTQGWGPARGGIGDFGANSAALEAMLDGDLWPKPVYRGEQMIQGQDYNSWPAIFQQLYKNDATYCEIYAGNFYDTNGNPRPHLADLRAQIAKFKSYVAKAAPKPPACHAGS